MRDPRELMVFVGAGVSYSAPSCLPVFNELRDRALRDLGLESELGDDRWRRVVDGLAPEPFMQVLDDAEVALVRWLSEALAPVEAGANVGHVALAQLARAGARLWTVNFDQLIERSVEPNLRVSAWPMSPARDSEVLKPHGSFPGKLIVTSEDVLRGLRPEWEARLREDARAVRTVAFVGYSGRDLDFRPLWDDALAGCAEVLWFGAYTHDEQEDRRRILPSVSDAGRLQFPEPRLDARGSANPTWDFVGWCQDRGLPVTLPGDLCETLFSEGVRRAVPPTLVANPLRAQAHVREALGDVRAARATYVRLLATGPQRRRAGSDLVQLLANHGQRTVTAVMHTWVCIPRVGRAGQFREALHRKWLTAISKQGRHDTILRSTRDLPDSAISTLLILRAASLRVAGSLDEAIETAAEATGRARAERHRYRVSHGAYQWCQALVWADQTDEAERVLDDELHPYAAITANRWVAWEQFLRGSIAVRRSNARLADRAFAIAEQLFVAEALTDGVVSVKTARLAAHRLDGNDTAYEQELRNVRRDIDQHQRAATYYSRGHPFTREAVLLDHAEFVRVHRGQHAEALALYEELLGSTFPLHAALASLGVALCANDGRVALFHAGEARTRARIIGARMIERRADAILDGADTRSEVFFC